MLEALFAQVPDVQFYEHVDFSTAVSEALFEMDAPRILYIAGPSSVGAGKDTLPIYLVAKELSGPGESMSLVSHGYIVLSSETTGEIMVFPVSGERKQPLHDADERHARDMADAPPGYVPKPTTTYYTAYRDLNADEMPGHDGKWTILAGSGSALSNTLRVRIGCSSVASQDAPVPQKNGVDVPGVTAILPLPAATPATKGRMQLAPVERDDATHVIYYSLPDDGQDHISSIPVHVLFSAQELEFPVVITIEVPKSSAHLKDATRLGAIEVQMRELLQGALVPGAAVPEEVYVVVISRGVNFFTGPVRLD